MGDAGRTIYPSHCPSLMFLSDFLEDFADEWMTKVMYGMRWNRTIDQEFSSLMLALINTAYPARHRMNLLDTVTPLQVADTFKQRQIGRRDLVGCADDDFMHYILHQILTLFEENLQKNWAQSHRSGKRGKSNMTREQRAEIDFDVEWIVSHTRITFTFTFTRQSHSYSARKK